MSQIDQLSPIINMQRTDGRIVNEATTAEDAFDADVRKVFVAGLNSMREGIAGCYLFHKAHAPDAIKKMLEVAGQDYKGHKGDLYSPLFKYVAKDIEDDIFDASVWATHRANCCRRLKQLDTRANSKHFKNAEALANFIKSQGGMVKLGGAYKASEATTSQPTDKTNPDIDEQALLLAAVKRLSHHDTDYALPSGSSELVALLAIRDAMGHASILGTLPMETDNLTLEMVRLLQGNTAALQDEIAICYRLVRLSEIFGSEQLLIGDGGKTVLIPQSRTDQNHKQADHTARIFVTLSMPLPVAGEINPDAFKKLRRAFKSPDKLYRYALSSSSDRSALIINAGGDKTKISLEPIRKSVALLVKPKSELLISEFTLPTEYLAAVVEAEEAQPTQTSELVISKNEIVMGGSSYSVESNVTQRFEVRQDLLTKTLRLLGELADSDVTVRTYDGVADISFHLINDHGDFAVEFASFEED